MRLVPNISELQQYNLCRYDRCYSEPFSNYIDIALQDYLPNQPTGSTFILTVKLMTTDGLTVVADISNQVDYIIGKDLAGNTYFNIRPAETLTLPACFLLHIIIEAIIPCFTPGIAGTFVATGTNNGVAGAGEAPTQITIYEGYSEPYQHIENGCIPGLVTLEGLHICFDITGRFYGAPKAILQQSGAFVLTDRHILKGRLKRSATDVKRSISEYGCRSIRTDISRLYVLEGFDLYPEWKVNEIESLFAAGTITIYGKEYVFRGGAIFEEEKLACSCMFKLAAKVEDCAISQEYGCETDCSHLCTYYIIGGLNKNQSYFDNNGELIGTTLLNLIGWLKAITGVNSVSEIDVSGVSCSAVAALKVDSNGTLPNFLYWGDVQLQNKVFARLAPCDTIDICAGEAGKCVTPVIISAEFELGCQTPGITSAIFEAPGGETICGLAGFDDWTIQPGYTSTIDGAGLVTLHFSARNAAYAGMDATDPIAENIAFLTGTCITTAQTYAIGASSQPSGAMPAYSWLYVQPSGTILFTGRVSNVTGSYAEININITYQQ